MIARRRVHRRWPVGLWSGALLLGLVSVLPLPISAGPVVAELRVQVGHTDIVQTIEFSNDGRQIRTTARDGWEVLWDSATGSELRRARGGEFVNTGSSEASDCRTSATVERGDGKKDAVRLKDSVSGKTIRLVLLPEFSGPRIRFSPDCGKVFIDSTVASHDSVSQHPDGDLHTGQVFDSSTGVELKRFTEGRLRYVESVAWLDDRHVLLASQPSALFDVRLGKKLRTFGRNGRLFARSKPSALLLTADPTPHLWNAFSGQELRAFSFGPAKASVTETFAAAFSRDEKYVAVVAGSGYPAVATVWLWSTSSGAEIRRFKLQPGYALDPEYPIAFSPDGKKLAVGGFDETVRVWDIASRKEIRLKGRALTPLTTEFSKDGRYLLTQAGPRLMLWDLRSGVVVPEFAARNTRAATLFPDGQKVLTCGDDFAAHIWDLTSHAEIHRFSTGKNHCSVVTVASDGLRIVTGEIVGEGGADIIRVWDTRSGMQLHSWEFENNGYFPSLGMTRDRGRILLGEFGGTATVIDATSGQHIHRLQGELAGVLGALNDAHVRGGETSMAFGPRPGEVLLGGWVEPRLVNTVTGKDIRKLIGHREIVNAVAISADGRRALSGSNDGTARLWDLNTGKEELRIRPSGRRVLSVAFSPGNGPIAIGTEEGATEIWSGDGKRRLATLFSFEEGWAVVDPSGRFDGSSLDSPLPLHWIASDQPMKPLPFEIFTRQYYTPKLLHRVLATVTNPRAALPALPGIGTLNRSRPTIGEPKVQAIPGRAGAVRVQVPVEPRTEDKAFSGARDLRLFRDGRLVGLRAGTLQKGVYTFESVALPSRKDIEFTAYAFNSDLVKSTTSHTVFTRATAPRPKTPRSFLINVGVNRYNAADCNLSHAVGDAQTLARVLGLRLPQSSATLLTSESNRSSTATRESIKAAIARVAARATPDDVFVLTFSGHGYTTDDGVFFILPSDVQGTCRGLSASQLKQSAISSDDLAEWLRPVDAGEMVVILDACYSSASVQTRDFKPGPMGSKGLGQLAYDKRIRILAASQSTQVAAANPWIGMGLLTFALAKDGLEAGRADWQLPDGKISLREWLSYGVKRVPELYAALREGRAREFGAPLRRTEVLPGTLGSEDLSLQTPTLFDFGPTEDPGIILQNARPANVGKK